jgi:hypothetical protein
MANLAFSALYSDLFQNGLHCQPSKADPRSAFESDAKISLPDQEKFILVFMMMPRKLSHHFNNFDLLTILSRNDFGSPMFGEWSKLLV